MTAVLLLLGAAALVTVQVAATSDPETRPAGPLEPLEVVAPLDQTLFPCDLAPPTFRWRDDSLAERWQIEVRFGDQGQALTVQVKRPAWNPRSALWEAIKQRSVTAPARVVITGFRRNRPDTAMVATQTNEGGDEVPVSQGSVTFQTSADPVAAPIFYRQVPLPMREALTHRQSIRWRLGDVASPEPPRTVLTGVPTCANCHTFSADGTTLAMDVDYGEEKGSYAIIDVKPQVHLQPSHLIRWSDFSPEDNRDTFGLLAHISPDGRYVVSTVKDKAIAVPLTDLFATQLFVPVQGILAVYDRQEQRFFALPGADDPRYVQTNPTWSPNGSTIVFARAEAMERSAATQLIKSGQGYRYDLYRLPFNGGAGGTAEPLPGASNNGRSNYFARYSPDGRWLAFCQADSLMFNAPSADLYLMPAAGGEAHRLTCNTADRMDSWHSWSPNSAWLVFATKANGPYTQLRLTHIDRDGNDSTPVLLDRFTPHNRAANLPEFMNPAGGDLVKIHFSDQIRAARRAASEPVE